MGLRIEDFKLCRVNLKGYIGLNYTETYRVWGFPKLDVPFLGRPIIRIVVLGGLYWGPLFWKLPNSLIIHGGKG